MAMFAMVIPQKQFGGVPTAMASPIEQVIMHGFTHGNKVVNKMRMRTATTGVRACVCTRRPHRHMRRMT